MADALLSLPLQIAVEKLTQVIGQKIALFAGATHELKRISNTFQSIKAILRDAESKQVTEESVRLWLSKLKAIAHDIEDLLDEWKLSAGDLDEENGSRTNISDDAGRKKVKGTCLSSPYACFDPSVSRYKIATQVREIRGRLDEIAGDQIISTFRSINSTSSAEGSGGEMGVVGGGSQRPQTSSFLDESDIIGREEDREKLVSWLISESSSGEADGNDGHRQEEVHVTAIVGVGGLGKTTLAQQIFNHPMVKSHFKQARYWVCVSDVFDVARLTKAILEEVNDACDASSFTQLNKLHTKLGKSLEGKHFLLVLDDVWNEVPEKWESLRLSLRGGALGSRILVTTRSENVAKIMNASYVHELKGLSDALSWELFSRRAFGGKKPEEFSEFKEIGEGIVKKCRGVPLSIKVMDSAMNTKGTVADWQNIVDSEMWSLPEVASKILPALQLSYYNLPPHLKQCFAYCSIYEKDAIMEKDELVKLWAVQGFIQKQGNREVEDIGEEYFNELVARSLFQVGEDRGGNTRCTMHDLLHELAQFITKDESCIFTTSKKSNPQCSSMGDVRHASLFSSKYNATSSIPSLQAKKLRTLFLNEFYRIDHEDLFNKATLLRALLFRHCRGLTMLPRSLGKLKHLRYLDLSWTSIVELPPKTIGELKQLRYLNLSRSAIVKLPEGAFVKMQHLRYLDLSYTMIKELPESVSHLVNLCTLNLNHCPQLKSLCGGIGEIVCLRHLYIDGTNRLDFLPKGFGKLTSLRSLARFMVGQREGEVGIDELQKLDSLEGCLEIQHLDRVSKAEQTVAAKLHKKRHIRTLVLDISSGREEEDDKEEERIKVLEHLQPHPNLQVLNLKGRSVSKLTLPSWMEDPSLSNLTTLSVSGFRYHRETRTMPGLGRLPALKCLEISEIGVGKLGDEFYYGIGINGSKDGVGKRRGIAFPKLETLLLKDLHGLEEWELTAEANAPKPMPSLRQLRVHGCGRLQLLPSHLATTPLSKVSESGDYDELKPLPPDHGLIAIELEIISCWALRSLPHSLGHLKKLKSLTINGANILTSLPDSLGQLKKLESLIIKGVEELKCLPNSLGQLESLQVLEVHTCPKLKSLPHSLGKLQELKILRIMYCKSLKWLPRQLRKLCLLQELCIDFCQRLSRRLSYQCKEDGKEWRKISHIKTIIIDGIPIER